MKAQLQKYLKIYHEKAIQAVEVIRGHKNKKIYYILTINCRKYLDDENCLHM